MPRLIHSFVSFAAVFLTVQAAQDFTVVIDVIPVGGVIPRVFFIDGLPIDTPQGVTARAADKAEEQQKDEGRHSYIFIRGLFALCCLRCCSSLAGAVCPRCSGSPTCLVASWVLPSELTATCVRFLLAGVISFTAERSKLGLSL